MLVSDEMVEKKKEDLVVKLEEEFRDFQKEWRKFLTNDFHRLVVNVDTLIKQNDGMQKNIVTMDKNIRTVQNCIVAIDEGILTLIKREH